MAMHCLTWMTRLAASAAAIVLLLPLLPTLACAADLHSPIGLWTTIDDSTGKPRGVVRIYQENGKLFGKLEKSFTPGAEARRCTKCADERKDKPVIGLVLIRNMSLDGDEYTGGDILDPDNGSVYRCKFKLEDGGKKLRVRGFIGFALFGRTQEWERSVETSGQ